MAIARRFCLTNASHAKKIAQLVLTTIGPVCTSHYITLRCNRHGKQTVNIKNSEKNLQVTFYLKVFVFVFLSLSSNISITCMCSSFHLTWLHRSAFWMISVHRTWLYISTFSSSTSRLCSCSICTFFIQC